MAKEHKDIEVLIIGAGMAGLTAALYAGRMNRKVLVLENALVGGQIANAGHIENYPGLPGVLGGDLIATVQQQAESFGATVDEFDTIEKVTLNAEEKIVETGDYLYHPRAVIIASGMQRRKLNLPVEKKFMGRGFHYCELCDGHMYQGKDIAVVGGGNAAVGAANILDKYARNLYIIHRSPRLTAEPVDAEALLKNPKAKFFFNTVIEGGEGDKALEKLHLRSKDTGETFDLPVEGVFVNIGVVPNTKLFEGQITMEGGRILAGEDCQTNVVGVFAAGDVRKKEIRQLTTAASDGTTAALMADRYLRSLAKNA